MITDSNIDNNSVEWYLYRIKSFSPQLTKWLINMKYFYMPSWVNQSGF